MFGILFCVLHIVTVFHYVSPNTFEDETIPWEASVDNPNAVSTSDRKPSGIEKRQIPINATCRAPIDLLFLVDKSASIKPDEWLIEKQFVQEMVSKFNVGPGPNDARIALSLFANHGNHTKWCFDKYTNNADVVQAVKDMSCPLCGHGLTATGGALQHSREKMLVRSCGARHGVAKIVVVMADGTSTEKPPKFPQGYVRDQANLIHAETNTQVIAIWIGEILRRALREMKYIASDDSLVFLAQNFSSLLPILDSVSERACEVVHDIEVHILEEKEKNINDLDKALEDNDSMRAKTILCNIAMISESECKETRATSSVAALINEKKNNPGKNITDSQVDSAIQGLQDTTTTQVDMMKDINDAIQEGDDDKFITAYKKLDLPELDDSKILKVKSNLTSNGGALTFTQLDDGVRQFKLNLVKDNDDKVEEVSNDDDGFGALAAMGIALGILALAVITGVIMNYARKVGASRRRTSEDHAENADQQRNDEGKDSVGVNKVASEAQQAASVSGLEPESTIAVETELEANKSIS